MNRLGSSRMRGQTGSTGLDAYAIADGRDADFCNPWNCFRLFRVDGRDVPDTQGRSSRMAPLRRGRRLSHDHGAAGAVLRHSVREAFASGAVD